MRLAVFILLTLLLANLAQAQKQLVLLKGERVIARYTQGQYFYCKLKNKQKREGKLIDLNETELITSNDTIKILSIESVKVKGNNKSTRSTIGTLLMTAGIGYLTLDQLNNLILRGETSLDKEVLVPSVILTAVGAGMVYIRSPYKKVYGHTLKTIDYSSRFYKLD